MNAAGSSMIMNQIAILKQMQGHEVQAGWFDTDRYQATQGQTAGVPVAMIARLNEFGGTIQHPGGTAYAATGKSTFQKKNTAVTQKFTGAHNINIPARPFMRLAYNNFQTLSGKLVNTIVGKIIGGKITVKQGLNQIGMELENQIVKSIKTGSWVPNAKSTVAKKGFDKPLIDTAHMWQSVNSKVI